MRVLYISRRYPPSTGGMEKLAYEVYRRLSRKEDVDMITWGGSNRWLFIVFPFFIIKSIYILSTKKIDIVHIGDGSISPLILISKIFRKPTVITIHALDITYSNKLYQLLIPICLKKAEKIICISNYAKEECIKRKISEKKTTVVLCGVNDEFYIKNKNIQELKKEIEKKYNICLENKKIIFSVGRLVERKGFHWFTKEVVPEILKKRDDFVYIIAGSGKFEDEIRTSINDNSLKSVVYMLGKVSDKMIKILYNSSDIFIMPNIEIEDDAEGFGLVILEAASCGLPIVASNLEGIQDAMKGYKKGLLVDAGDVRKYSKIINNILEGDKSNKANPEKDREYIINNCNWDLTSEEYIEVFKNVINKKCKKMK